MYLPSQSSSLRLTSYICLLCWFLRVSCLKKHKRFNILRQMPAKESLIFAVVSWLIYVQANCTMNPTDKCMFCHTEIKHANQTRRHFVRPQYTDTRPTSPSSDPMTLGVWQGTTGPTILVYWYDSSGNSVKRTPTSRSRGVRRAINTFLTAAGNFRLQITSLSFDFDSD